MAGEGGEPNTVLRTVPGPLASSAQGQAATTLTQGDLAREHGVSTATIYSWRAKFGGMDVSEAKRLKELEDENRRLKQMVADLSLDKEAMKSIIAKKW